MKRGLRFVSLFILLWLTASCAREMSGKNASLPPLIKVEQGKESQKYHMQLDLMKHHFSGMLLVRRMSGDEIRILASTYFGLSLFDFSFRGDTLHVNSCLDPLKKEKIRKLLEEDFRLLFLNGTQARVKEKNAIFEKRISGKGFGKTVFSAEREKKANPVRVKIKHPWIGLTILLDQQESSPNVPLR